MSTNFPVDLDTIQNPSSTDNTQIVSHAGQHANANDAIEALEAKVGKDSSAVTTSHDYKLSLVTGSNKALPNVSPTITTPTINVGSDATGDIYYRHSDGTLKRLAAEEGKILKIVSGVPTYATETTVVDASTTAKGVVEEATLAEIDANTGAGATSARLFVNPSTLGKSVDGTMADNSDAKIPSQKAVKTYVDGYSPTKKVGVAARAGNTASGSQTIAHGLGRTPKIVRITAVYGEPSAGSGSYVFSHSFGSFDGTNIALIYTSATYSTSATGQYNSSTSVIIYIFRADSSGATSASQGATISVDGTNITLNWTYTQNNGGTIGANNIRIMWEVE